MVYSGASIMSKVGKMLKLQHTQSFGKSVGLRKVKPTYLTIVLEYDNGMVQVEGLSDTWEVIPSKDSKAHFETC